MAPYVAVMLPVLVGFSLLALDASRRMSLQTQMQAAADGLALAGARELNKGAGAELRAISAMANAYGSTKSANTVVGVGSSPTLTYTYAFYSGLSAASEGVSGVEANGDSDAKYVAVKVTPQTWSTILPATFLASVPTNAFAVGADAVAGFAGTTVCSVAPIFVCNPYEFEFGIDDRRASDGGPLRSVRQPRDPSAPAEAQPKRRRPRPLRLAEYRRRLQGLRLAWPPISQA